MERAADELDAALPVGVPPVSRQRWLRADRALRLVIGLGWIGLAATPSDAPVLAISGGLAAAARPALLGCGALVLLGLAPRAVSAAGLALSLPLLPPGSWVAAWLVLAGAAAGRLALRRGVRGRWLREVERLARDEALGCALLELGRALAARAAAAAESSARIARAGDAYERAGRARAALRLLGVEARAFPAAARLAARGIALALRPAPGLLASLERRLFDAAAARAHGSDAPRAGGDDARS